MKSKISNYKLFKLALDKEPFDSIDSKKDIVNVRKINDKYDKYMKISLSLVILFLLNLVFCLGFEFKTFALILLTGIGFFFPLMFISGYIENKKYAEKTKYYTKIKKQREKQFSKFLKEKFGLNLKKEENIYSLALVELRVRLKNKGIKHSALSKKELYNLFKEILKKEYKEFLKRKEEFLNIEILQ